MTDPSSRNVGTAGERPRGKPRGIRRDRDCQSCKLRSVKCDLNRPRCLPCQEANLPCGGYPQKIRWAVDSSKPLSQSVVNDVSDRSLAQSTISSSTSPTQRSDSEPQSSPRRVSDTHQLNSNSLVTRLASYCRRIAFSEDQEQGRGSRLSVEDIRLVSRFHNLLQARGGGTAMISIGTVETHNVSDITVHHLAALTNLHDALQSAKPVALIGIAAFAVFEVCDSAFGDWQRHLYGARSLLDHHCRDYQDLQMFSERITGLSEVVAMLAWFDVNGTIIRGTTGLILNDWHRQVVDEQFLAIVGCPKDTFDLYIRIAKGEVITDPLSSALQAMDQLLKLDTDQTDWGRSANAHRCAITIAVLTRIDFENMVSSNKNTLATAVERTCQVLASTPKSSMYYMHMGVPAYLAGINAISTQQCDIIRNYWISCDLGGVPRYPGGLAGCEKVWRERELI